MNGYFKVEVSETGTTLFAYPPKDGGIKVDIGEVKDYLLRMGIPFDGLALNIVANRVYEETQVQINQQYMYPAAETMMVAISSDRLTATVRFYAPSSQGKLLTESDIIGILNYNKVVHGIDVNQIRLFLANREYCTDYVLAQGTRPIIGKNAVIQYLFETSHERKPTLNEDGTVNFFQLNTISHCKRGDVLATMTPEEQGQPGITVQGEVIPSPMVKRGILKFGRNILLSEDKLSLISTVDGHVMLVDDRVFVSDVFEVENVDNSTGNIEYSGNVEVRGNVFANFSIKAEGNVIVKGVVEGAYIEAGGDIIIARGVNGMGKGVLKARGNIISKFIENATAIAGGYVETESILLSKVMSQTEIQVVGRRGFISGSKVSATHSITAKTLGSDMGSDTSIEIGIDPTTKQRYQELKASMIELNKSIRQIKPVLAATAQKIAAGIPVLPEQAKYIQVLRETCEEQERMLQCQMEESEKLESLLEGDSRGYVVVAGEVYSGTRITISGVTLVIKDTVSYCRFIKSQGEVKMTSV